MEFFLGSRLGLLWLFAPLIFIIALPLLRFDIFALI